MSFPTLMQKGLSALLKVVKLTGREGISKVITILEEHFTLSTYEITKAYQTSYECALEAISIGLGKTSFLSAHVIQELAQQIIPTYLKPFASYYDISNDTLTIFCTKAINQCQSLTRFKEQLFPVGAQMQLTEAELVALMTDTEPISITNLVLEQLRNLNLTSPYLDDELIAFFSYNNLLGNSMLFFLHEQLRQEPRVEKTLAILQRQGLWQDVRALHNTLNQLMRQFNLSSQLKPSDEFTHHNKASLQEIAKLFTQLEQLSPTIPHYSQLAMMEGNLLSSIGALPEAETCFIQAQETALTSNERALAAFNRFQLQLRNYHFESALIALQEAIQLDPHHYTLHDIDKYPIIRILGAGSMGCVLLCQHKLQKKWVIVKCFWNSPQGSTEDVFKEAFIMSKIANDYVPMPLDYGYVDSFNRERAFFVTEYIEDAIDAETWLKQRGKLNLATGLSVGFQIAKGLQAAHSAGILHLDLKPANILLKKTASTEISVKIIDFGLSHWITPIQQPLSTKTQLTQISSFGQTLLGTLDYAPPEQQGSKKYGKPTVKSDVFAFGATLYRLLTHESPRHLNPKKLAQAPELFDLLCDCLAEDPMQRVPIDEIINKIVGLKNKVQPIQLKEKPGPIPQPDRELEKLLEIARQKYEQGSSSFTPITSAADKADHHEVYVTCPYCDWIFVVSDEGEIECPKCHWDFEIDDDGDVISSYEYEEHDDEIESDNDDDSIIEFKPKDEEDKTEEEE